MKIIDLKTTILEEHWGPWRREWLLVRLDTDEGICGFGEAAAPCEQVKALVLGMKEQLLGEDPTEVERLFRKITACAYSGFGASHFDSGLSVHAVSAIETALWDLAGKYAGLPVYRLLGGRHREKVRLYACVGGLDTYLGMQDVYQQLGIKLLKFDTSPVTTGEIPGSVMDTHLTRKGLEYLVKEIEKIHSKVGNIAEIAIEGRCGTLSNALRFLKSVEPFDLAWVEDPLPPTNIDEWSILTTSSQTPILTGEGLHLRHEFNAYYTKHALRIAAPDFQVCGGLSEGKKIAEMADLQHLLVAPHNASSAIGIAAAVHACAAIPNLLALEFHAMPHWDRILKGYKPKIENGYIDVPTGPGLGVELDDQQARRLCKKGELYFGE